MDKQTLIAQIIQAFAGVRLGSGIGFLEADCVDDYLPADSPERRHCRAQDECGNWQALLPWLDENPLRPRFHPQSAFTFMDAEGRRFALPCYLIWLLEDHVHAPELGSLLSEHTLHHLPLSPAQQQAVRAVILYECRRSWQADDDIAYDENERLLALFDQYFPPV